MEKFRYELLDASKAEIRLFQLDAAPKKGSTAPISGQLMHVSLDSCPKYEALSYTWGTPDPGSFVELNGARFKCRENLYAALHRLQLPKKPRMLWIDAICINQDDVKERELQVLLMRRIYERAERVIVWLGELTPAGRLGMKLLHGRLKLLYNDFRDQQRRHGFDRAYLSRILQSGVAFQDDENLADERSYGGIRELLDRPWWQRVWIAQEAVLAKELILMCGRETASWDRIGRMIRGSTLHGGYSELGVRYHPLLLSFPDASYEQISRLRSDRILGQTHRIVELLFAFKSFHCTDSRDRIFAFLGLASDSDFLKIRPDYTITLEKLFHDFAWHHVRTHKDLSILNYARASNSTDTAGQTTLAYTPTEQIKYHDTDALISFKPGEKARIGWARLPDGWERRDYNGKVQFVNHNSGEKQDASPLDHSDVILVPPFVSQRILPKGWMKTWDNLGRVVVEFKTRDDTRTSTRQGDILNLPSWMPNWSLHSRFDPAPILEWRDGSPAFHASGKNATVRMGRCLDERILCVEGMIIDEISLLGPVWHPATESPPRSRMSIQALEDWEQLAYNNYQIHQGPSPYGPDKSREEAFWRVHIADPAPPHGAPYKDIAYFFTWLDGDKWDSANPRWERSSLETFGDSLAFRFKTRLRMKAVFRDNHKTISPLVGLMPWTIERRYEHYLRRIHKVCAHRAFFITKKGYMGIGPWNMTERDKIAVIFGGSTPFLLRDVPEKEGYELVGESYISGLMEGEALKETGRENATMLRLI